MDNAGPYLLIPGQRNSEYNITPNITTIEDIVNPNQDNFLEKEKNRLLANSNNKRMIEMAKQSKKMAEVSFILYN